MTEKKIYLIRHAETQWALSGKHTGITDIPLTQKGKKQARILGKVLRGHAFGAVFTSPMQRCFKTCEIAGFAKKAIVTADLVEWNYGSYEGITSAQIHKRDPHWNIFLHGAPKGESVNDIASRTQKLLQFFQDIPADIAVFSHGHFLRALTARFIELPIANARNLSLSPAAICILTYENRVPVIHLWNATFNTS